MMSAKDLFEENRRSLFLLAFTAAYAAYLAFGGLMFLLIEGPQEDEELKNMAKIKDTVITKYPFIPVEALDDFMKELSSHGVKGLVLGNSTSKWTYGNALLFSATLLTTIGYGHLAPMSALGKVLCMMYTGLGIPITLLLLAHYVERLMAVSQRFKESLFARLSPHMSASAIRLLHVTIVMTFIVVGCFLVPALVFCWLEVRWSYLDAIYFCFISLTTVGLGDFVPGLITNHPYIDLYRFGAAVYIIVGVTVMMFMMAVTADFVQNFNKPYQPLLPVAMSQEKLPITDNLVQSYGSLRKKPTDLNKNFIEH